MDKPFKTYDELIDLLEMRGLSTGPNARFILEHEGYYPVVNGYKDPFLKSSDRFRPGATLDEVYALFVMDRRLRSVMFRYMALCEGMLKTVSTYVFCSRHADDNEAYLDTSNYAQDARRSKVARAIVREMSGAIGRVPGESPKFKKDYLDHYQKNHDNVPLWVTMNCLSLGQAFKFYSAQDESTRFAIAQEFQRMHRASHPANPRRITHASLERSFDHIKDFRNICAHDERLYCARVDRSKSTDFRRLLSDMRTILTPDECEALLADVRKVLAFADERIATVPIESILSRMGLASLRELDGVLRGDC